MLMEMIEEVLLRETYVKTRKGLAMEINTNATNDCTDHYAPLTWEGTTGVNRTVTLEHPAESIPASYMLLLALRSPSRVSWRRLQGGGGLRRCIPSATGSSAVGHNLHSILGVAAAPTSRVSRGCWKKQVETTEDNDSAIRKKSIPIYTPA